MIEDDESTCGSCEEFDEKQEEEDEYADWSSESSEEKSEDSDDGYSSEESVDNEKKMNLVREIRKSLSKMTNNQISGLQTRLSRPKTTTRRNIWKE